MSREKRKTRNKRNMRGRVGKERKRNAGKGEPRRVRSGGEDGTAKKEVATRGRSGIDDGGEVGFNNGRGGQEGM